MTDLELRNLNSLPLRNRRCGTKLTALQKEAISIPKMAFYVGGGSRMPVEHEAVHTHTSEPVKRATELPAYSARLCLDRGMS